LVIAFAPCSQHLGFFSDPVEGIVPRVLAFDVAGPMARNVADIAFVHTAMVYEAELTAADLRDVRIGVRRAYYWEILDADVAKIMEESLDKLRLDRTTHCTEAQLAAPEFSLPAHRSSNPTCLGEKIRTSM
jgi:Asp-tRNA(Asn)/Glu-tRNA(Gln) amidotransferase A subunit family amidase